MDKLTKSLASKSPINNSINLNSKKLNTESLNQQILQSISSKMHLESSKPTMKTSKFERFYCLQTLNQKGSLQLMKLKSLKSSKLEKNISSLIYFKLPEVLWQMHWKSLAWILRRGLNPCYTHMRCITPNHHASTETMEGVDLAREKFHAYASTRDA